MDTPEEKVTNQGDDQSAGGQPDDGANVDAAAVAASLAASSDDSGFAPVAVAEEPSLVAGSLVKIRATKFDLHDLETKKVYAHNRVVSVPEALTGPTTFLGKQIEYGTAELVK